MNAAKVVEDLKQRFPNEPEYIQAVFLRYFPPSRKSTTSTPSLKRQTSSSAFASPIVFVSSVLLG